MKPSKTDVEGLKFYFFLIFFILLAMNNSYLSVMYLLGTCFFRWVDTKASEKEYDFKELGFSLVVSFLILEPYINI